MRNQGESKRRHGLDSILSLDFDIAGAHPIPELSVSEELLLPSLSFDARFHSLVPRSSNSRAFAAAAASWTWASSSMKPYMSAGREDEVWSIRRVCSKSLANTGIGHLLAIGGAETGTCTITKDSVNSLALLW